MSANLTRYVALLRGVNVGGNRKLSMAALRATCESIGCTNVATYIQSGNAVLTSPLDADDLRAALERALAEQLELASTVMIRTHRQLTDVLADNPFPDADTSLLHIGFLTAPLEADVVVALGELSFPPEEFVVLRSEIYLHLPNGMGRAKLPPILLAPRRLTTTVTVRNWRTVTRLAEMSA